MRTLTGNLDGLASHGSAAAWSPAALSPVGWWKADAITGKSNGDPVPTWADSSGNGFDATITGYGGADFAAPTLVTNGLNGLPVLNFAYGPPYAALRAYHTVDKPYTVASLAAYYNNGVRGRIVGAIFMSSRPGYPGANALWGFHTGSSNRFYDDAEIWMPTHPSFSGEWWQHIGSADGHIGLGDGTGANAYAEGSVLVEGKSGTDGMGKTLALSGYGPNAAGNTEFSDCRIAEVLIWDTALSQSNRQKVEGYLAAKWGRQAALPADHPYKASAP